MTRKCYDSVLHVREAWIQLRRCNSYDKGLVKRTILFLQCACNELGMIRDLFALRFCIRLQVAMLPSAHKKVKFTHLVEEGSKVLHKAM